MRTDSGCARFRPAAGAVRAVLAVASIAFLAGCATGQPVSDHSAQQASATAGVVIAPAAMLTPSDFTGTGWRVRKAAANATAPGWRWALNQCIAYDAAAYPAQQHRTAVRHQSYGQRAGHEAGVVVEGFAPGWGARSLEDTREVLDTCGVYEYTDAKNDFRESHAIVAESYAGDESLVVETVRIAPPSPTKMHYTAVVRRGDLVVTVIGTGLAQDEVRRLATLAASRLV